MSFVVVNSVQADKAQLPALALEVQRAGLDSLRGQPGFRGARLMIAENETELLLVIEWDNRESFVTFRQTELGRRIVETAAKLRPRIEFYEAISTYEP